MPGRRRGARRVRLGSEPYECFVCGKPTGGIPAQGLSLGYRSANLVCDDRVVICASEDCIAYFDRLLEEDDVDRDARRKAWGEPKDEERIMTDEQTKAKEDVLHFGQLLTRQVLTTLWQDGGSLYQRTRGGLRRAVNAVALGVLGAGVGAVSGFLMRTEPREQPTEQERLLRTVSTGTIIRQALPAVEQMFTQMEYDARKRLEEMGYYPCSECGVPHVKEERHHMPAGTYWHNAKERYVRPDDPEWSKEEYEAAAGERWDLDDDADDGAKMH